jgi:hypothetical protein
MPQVYVDVDLDEFETFELVSELVRRINTHGRKRLTQEQKLELLNEMEELQEEIGGCGMPIKSLDDKMKLEVVNKYWPLLTSFQFEEKLSK